MNTSKTKQLEIPQTKSEPTAPQSDKDRNLKLGAHIMAAIDLEANFKLYSYRVITEEAFIERSRAIIANVKNL